MTFRLRDADRTLKLFLTMFLVVLTTGYAIGLFFVEHSASMRADGIEQQFLGNEHVEGAEEIRFAKSANEMFVFMHNHIISLAMMFFVVGGIFFFSSLLSENVKRLLILEPFVATLTTFGGIALVRYVSPVFSWLVLVSGISLFICYCTVIFLIFKELWLSDNAE